MSSEPEPGLETLLIASSEHESDIEADLVKSCFEIQKKYQFDHDRTLSTNAMDRIIESYVDRAVEKLAVEGS